MDADQLHQLVLASLNGAERNAIVVPQLDVVVHTAEDLLRAVCEGTENDTDILEALLQALRVLRNACASGRAAVLRLQAAGAIPMLQTAVDAVGCGAATLNWQFPALLAQLLANACAGNPEFAAPAWSCLFPAHITKLAHVRSGGTQPALSLALLSCALTVPGAAAQLSGPRGSATLTALLCGQQHQLQSDQGTPNDNLGLLLTQLCFQQQFLLPLFLSLCQNEDMGGPPTSLPSSHHLTASQAFLLQELSVEAQRAPNLATTAEPAPPDSNQAHAAMQFLCTLVQHLAAESKLAPLDEGGRQVLQDALQLLAGIAGRDDGGAALTGGTSLMAGFHKEGGLPGLLAMLLALGPVRNPRRRDEAESAEWPFVAVALREQAQRFAGEPPYRGYRSDILAVIANGAHGRSDFQDAVASMGGVELVLAQCQVDEASPLAREWGLWAVRNLCEGSAEARQAIAALEACEAVDSEELQRAGMRVSVDRSTGKVKVQPREGALQAGQPAPR